MIIIWYLVFGGILFYMVQTGRATEVEAVGLFLLFTITCGLQDISKRK